MLGPFLKTAVLGGIWIAMTSLAAAQSMRPFEQPVQRYAAIESRPTVSPYINLANNSTGYSNYQTLVRPLIEERAELNRQWTALEQLNSQMQRTPGSPARSSTAGRSTSPGRSQGVRYMHYSHYFSTNQ